MLRLLAFLIVLAPITYGGLWLADHPGAVTIVWQGYEIRMALGILIALALLAAFILVIAFMLLRGVMTSPKRLRERQQLRRYESGLDALNRSMIAIALADHREAERQARRARHFFRANPPVLQLLEVQIAHATGKEAAAREVFEHMLEDDMTRPVALRGKIGELMKAGELVHARDFAEEAFRKRPQDSWLAMVQLDILFREQDWAAIEALIDRARRKGALSVAQAGHFRATSYLQRASAALKDELYDRALDLAQLALRQEPRMLPARLLIAQILGRKQELKPLLSFLEESWAITPHPVFAELFLAHACDDGAAKTLKRLEKLRNKNPQHLETLLLEARIFMHQADWLKARNALKSALSKAESPRLFQMLSEVESREKGDDKLAAGWLARAVNAPKDSQWVCAHCGHIHAHWQSHCLDCLQFDAIEWMLPADTRTGETHSLLEA